MWKRNNGQPVSQKILISHVFELLLNSDVDMYRKNNAIAVMVNGVEIPNSNLPYLHPSGFCFVLLI